MAPGQGRLSERAGSKCEAKAAPQDGENGCHPSLGVALAASIAESAHVAVTRCGTCAARRPFRAEGASHRAERIPGVTCELR